MHVYINKLYALPAVPLANEDSSMMNAFGQSELKDLCLKATLQEIFESQTKHIIKLHLCLIQHTNSNQTAQKSITLSTETVTCLTACSL